jgi:hypothetical protein
VSTKGANKHIRRLRKFKDSALSRRSLGTMKRRAARFSVAVICVYMDHATSNNITFDWHACASSEAKLFVSFGPAQNITLVLASAPQASNASGQVAGDSTEVL